MTLRRAASWLCLALLSAAGSCGDGGGGGEGVLAVIVGFNGPVDVATFQTHGGTVDSVDPVLGTVAGLMPAANIPALQAEPNVSYVEEDRPVYSTELNLRAETKPWGVYHIAADFCWTISDGSYAGGAPVKCGILDTGIDTTSAAAPNATHEDLAGQAEFGINETTYPDPDVDGHGTHVSGTVAAKQGNGLGVAGVAPKALCVAVKVLGDTGSGSTSDVNDGIRWAADNGCKVINMSFGSMFGSSSELAAVDYAWGQGVVLVAAAGNSSNKKERYPAAYTNCIAVVATDQDDQRPNWSTYGSWTDISAPGVSILSTVPGNAYATASGTSMACPHVVGVAALLWAEFPAQTNLQIRQRLENNAAGPIDGGTIPDLVDPYTALVAP